MKVFSYDKIKTFHIQNDQYDSIYVVTNHPYEYFSDADKFQMTFLSEGLNYHNSLLVTSKRD